jgi:hypothetical protein
MASGEQRLPSDDGLVHVRPATIDDADALASLSGELGYPATATQLGARLQSLLTREHDHVVLVATIEEAIVGWITSGFDECWKPTKTQHVYLKTVLRT